MSDIPDGVDHVTANLAVAWEIAKIAYPHGAKRGTSRAPEPEDKVKNLTNACIKAYLALKSQNPIQG